MVVLKLFGAALLEGADGVMTGPAAQRHRLALLAILAEAQARAVPREKLMALLWPEREGEHVRNLLKQSVYVLRKALGERAITSAGDALRLEPGAIRCDVIDFERAMAAGDYATAVERYNGPFLDGFFLNEAQDFEAWAAERRSGYADAYARALQALAVSAEAHGDLRSATAQWRILVAHSPFDTRAVLQLMRSLDLAGDRAAALRHAEAHERALKDELGMRPPADFVALVASLQGLRPGDFDGSPFAPPATVAERHSDDPASQPDTGRQTGDARDSSRGNRTPSADEHSPTAAPAQTLPPPAKASTGTTHWKRPGLYIAAAAISALIVALYISSPPDSGVPPETTTVSVDEIAKLVAEEFDRRLRGEPVADQPARRTQNIAAYEAYLRGNDPAMLRSPDAARQGLAYFRQAVALDPGYAAAWAGLARMSLRVANDDGDDSEELYRLTETAALKAVSLDDSLAEAHAVMGLLRMLDFDLLAAEAWMQRAVILDPGRASTREWLVGLHLWMGKQEQALAEAERAVELDPLSPSATAELARALAANNRCDEALERLDSIASVQPPLLRVPLINAQCLAATGSWQSAIEELRQAPGAAGPIRQALLGHVLARAGQRDEAEQIRETLLGQWHDGNGDTLAIAVLHAGLGDTDQFFSWIEQAIADRSLVATPDQFTLLQPVLEQFRDDPRLLRLSALSQWRDHGGR
jgi:DNA-binding SARP family transcriptional activator